MIPESLSPDLVSRALNLADLTKTQRLLVERVCVEDMSLQQAAGELALDLEVAEELYDTAYAACAQALIGSELEYYRELLTLMRGHRRHAPKAPKIIVDRYNSAPGKPAFKTVSTSHYPNEFDYVREYKEHETAAAERQRVARLDPGHPNAGKKRRGL